MNPNTRPAQNISRQQSKRVRAAAIATKNQLAMRNSEGERVYLAPPNAGRLDGNRATRQRRLAGFAAMKTIRSHGPKRRAEAVIPWDRF